MELAALDGWAAVGTVPAEAVEAIRSRAVAPTPQRVAELEAQTQHDVAAFVDAIAENLGEEGRWFHYGLTSSDVLDTALALQIRDAGALILGGNDRAFAAVVSRAEEHRETHCMRRTHGFHAEPTTLGLTLASWAFSIDPDRSRAARARGMRVGKLSGAVGTYWRPIPRSSASRASGWLEPAPPRRRSARPPRRGAERARRARLSLDRYALEIRHRPYGGARSRSRSARARRAPAMPHKRNPITAERICGSRASSAALRSSARERRPLARARHLALRGARRRPRRLRDRLHARPLRLASSRARRAAGADAREPEASHHLFFSQRLLLALVESGLPRDDAYRHVQRLAMRAWDEGLTSAGSSAAMRSRRPRRP